MGVDVFQEHGGTTIHWSVGTLETLCRVYVFETPDTLSQTLGHSYCDLLLLGHLGLSGGRWLGAVQSDCMIRQRLVSPDDDSLAIKHLLVILGTAVTRHTQAEDSPLSLLGATGAELVLLDCPG